MNKDNIDFKEARRLSKLFPDRYKFYMRIVRPERDNPILMWKLTETRELQLNEEVVYESHPFGASFDPIPYSRTCYQSPPLTHLDYVDMNKVNHL